jgi:hypothetical protein
MSQPRDHTGMRVAPVSATNSYAYLFHDDRLVSSASEPEAAGQRGWISPIGPKPSCGVSM